MSLDFPDRKKWLAIRSSPKEQTVRLLVDSGTDGTFSAGRNAAKRALGKGRQRVKKRKALQRLRRGFVPGRRMARDLSAYYRLVAEHGRQVRPHRSGRGA